MHLQSHASQRSLQYVARAIAGGLLVVAVPLAPAPAQADRPAPDRGFEPSFRLTGSTLLCSGYSDCRAHGYSDSGYQAASGRMYWRMYAGTNCTNYTAYRMVRAGMPNVRPWSGSGNATNWGYAMRSITDGTPVVGAIAWWKANVPGAGSAGHTAFVEKVLSPTEIVVSESNWGRTFDWRRISKTGNGWPTGFIHFRDVGLANVTPPTVTGTPAVLSPLTADPGTWSPQATFTYQWLADGVAIDGATAPTFTPRLPRMGQRLSVRVTASRPGMASVSVTSAAAAPVGTGTLVNSEPPVVSGPPQVGTPLTVSQPAFLPAVADRSVLWLADGRPVAGATGLTFTPTTAELGRSLSVSVVARRKGFNDLTVTSAPVGPVLEPEIVVSRPGGVAGSASVGERLSVDPGAFQPGDATATYTWLRDGRPVPGVGGPAYTLTGDDLGHRVSVQVLLHRDGYRDKQLSYDLAELVTTTPQIKLAAAGRSRSAVVWVRAAAPGFGPMGARVTVRVGKQSKTFRLSSAGTAKVRFDRLRAGRRAVVLEYAGTTTVRGARVTTVVDVQR